MLSVKRSGSNVSQDGWRDRQNAEEWEVIRTTFCTNGCVFAGDGA